MLLHVLLMMLTKHALRIAKSHYKTQYNGLCNQVMEPKFYQFYTLPKLTIKIIKVCLWEENSRVGIDDTRLSHI